MIKSVIPALGLALLASLAHADGDYTSPTDDRVRATLGAMHVSTATTMRVDSSTGVPGTTIGGESQFGLDPSDFEPKFQVMVRGGERNRLWLDYFTLDRTGSTIVQQPIVFRNVVLQPGNPLQSELDLRLLTLTYGYSFWHTEKLELAATLGVSAVQIAATAKVQTDAVHLDQTENEAGPFATPGISATWVVSKRFYLDGRVQYLQVHIQQLDGSLGMAELAALYRLRPNVSFGLGYTQVKAHLASTKADDSGLFDFNSKGPEFFVRVAF
ncbi:MAG TPA: hypothetical protein VHY75_10830 [Steroidobacteraceae bacterium]|jgi:hypothetical protein|nr:hypothetical protein [Steroidobacteraceae bacterium]